MPALTEILQYENKTGKNCDACADWLEEAYIEITGKPHDKKWARDKAREILSSLESCCDNANYKPFVDMARKFFENIAKKYE